MGLQEQLGESIGAAIGTGGTTNADFVFVIDATQSMTPVIETVKNYTKNFQDNVNESLSKYGKSLNQCRVKVIVYRDYYCDGPYAMDETDFYILPEENDQLNEYISGIEAKGGGDAPESALEALSLAMHSEWETEGTSKRHVIVLFTDAPAHPLEKRIGIDIPNYPSWMPANYDELYDAWQGAGQGTCVDGNWCRIEGRPKRLIIFAPDMDPWNDIAVEFDQCIYDSIKQNDGGAEIKSEVITDFLGRSVS